MCACVPLSLHLPPLPLCTHSICVHPLSSSSTLSIASVYTRPSPIPLLLSPLPLDRSLSLFPTALHIFLFFASLSYVRIHSYPSSSGTRHSITLHFIAAISNAYLLYLHLCFGYTLSTYLSLSHSRFLYLQSVISLLWHSPSPSLANSSSLFHL